MLTYQGDGNLVLYGPSGAIWHTATWGVPGYAMMQGDGNLVVRNNVGMPLWWSGTSTPNAYLSVHDSGHVAVSTEPFSEVWSAGFPPPPPGGGGGGGGSNPGSVPSGGRLYEGQSAWSPSGAYFLTLQGDGNLVLYTAGGTPLWATGTVGTSPGRLEMQSDGNLVLYDSGGTPVWATMTNYNPGAYLNVQDDSNVVIYGAAGAPLWAR